MNRLCLNNLLQIQKPADWDPHCFHSACKRHVNNQNPASKYIKIGEDRSAQNIHHR